MTARANIRLNAWPGCVQAGMTIVELMISITLGLLVVMAATALLVSAKTSYTSQDNAIRVQETGRYALEIIARSVRQAAYENWDSDEAPVIAAADLSANIAGLDAHSLKESANGIEAASTASVNGSDVLAVRFFGAGAGSNGDGTIINCAGFGVPAPLSGETAEQDRGWSIFYVASSNGEPELRCKYRGKSAWASDAIARGVESFQVLYGLDSDEDGLPNTFLTATAINAMDSMLVLEGADEMARARDRNKKTPWKKITVVKVALLVRGERNSGIGTSTVQYDLFGKDYGDAHADRDRGTRIEEKALSAAARNRIRKTFVLTIQLRNRTVGSEI